MRCLFLLAGLLAGLIVTSFVPAADDKKVDDKKAAPAAEGKKADKKPAVDDKKEADKKKEDAKKAADKKKDTKPDSESTEKTEPKEKLLPAGELIAKLVDVQPSQKILAVEVHNRVTIPNPSAAQQMATLQIQLRQAMQTRDRARIQSIYQQMAQQQGSMMTVRDDVKRVDLQATEDMKIRVAQPPAETDEKGNFKKYTAKELKELKGPGNLWGYPADFDSLRTGQIVQVFLGRKNLPKVNPKDSDADKEALQADSKPLVTMVYIRVEAPAAK